jgi:selenide,water dikinase
MAQVLRQLQPQEHPDLIVGAETLDDAGVFRLDSEIALVQTVDFFPPLVDDPYEFGRIAAANALSDVYAMGGVPLTCLNIVGFPDQALPPETLVDILRGGAERAAAAGAVIVGGHSVRDTEVKYGMAVTGRVHPDRVWTNAAAKPGDLLVLTKPLGSGVLTSAVKAGKMPLAELDEAIGVMIALNRAARDAAVDAQVHACTDVTGFGLVGHAFEIAEASDVTIVLNCERVPLMRRTLEFARAGVLTRAYKTARAYLADRLVIDDGVEDALANVLCDAQTSGGLLFSVAAGEADALVERLELCGTSCAAIVGQVRAARTHRITLSP